MAVEIRAVSEQMEAALKRVPALRRKVVESVTQKVKARLDTEIASRVRDTHGKIRGWQEIRIGSKAGYGVIAPVRDGSGRDSPGAITRYLEVGHRIRKPKKADAKGYRPRIRVAAVAGRFFYKSADAQKEGIINAELKKFEKELAENLDLEGKN